MSMCDEFVFLESLSLDFKQINDQCSIIQQNKDLVRWSSFCFLPSPHELLHFTHLDTKCNISQNHFMYKSHL